MGVSFWLDTPNVNLNSPSALLFTLNFGKSVSIKVELLLDQKQPEAGSDKPKKQIEDKNANGDDLRESDDSSSDMMIDDLNAPVFYLQVSLLKIRADRKVEVKASSRVLLEDMIDLSVYHLHGFNHYVAQLNKDCSLDIFINSHDIVKNLFP